MPLPNEPTSEPAYIDEPVTFLDILFVGGFKDSLTLPEGSSSVEIDDKWITLRFKDLELIVIERQNILMWSERKGVIRRLAETPGQPPAHERSKPSAPLAIDLSHPLPDSLRV